MKPRRIGMAFGLLACVLPGFSAEGAVDGSKEKEFLLHEYEKIMVFAIRPSTVRTLLNPRLSPSAIRTEPEFTIESRDYGYIEDFLARLRDSGERVPCDEAQQILWVAALYRGDSEEAALFGNERYYSSAEDSCFRLSGLTLSSLFIE